MSQQGTIEPGENGHVDTFFRCALCPAPALLACAVETTALGLGDAHIYLCQNDYDLLLARQQAILLRQAEAEQAAATFEQAQRAILAAALQHFGGTWPPRAQLWRVHDEAERRNGEAREAYRAADDASPAGRLARLQVLHSAGLSLALALCIEARAQQDSTSDSAVSGALMRVTMAFFQAGGLVMRHKEITRPEVMTAALAIMRYRAAQPENEPAELVAIEAALAALGREQSS